MIRNYLKVAWRALGKSRMHAFINIGGLAIGLSVAILIALWIYDELSFDRNFPRYDRIAQVIQNVTNNGEVQTWRSVPYPLAEEIRTNYGSDFSHVIMAASTGDHLLAVGDQKFKETGGFFEDGICDMLTLPMVQGNRKSLDEPASVIISASAAKALFGTQPAMDRMIRIDDHPVVKVTGVYRDFPKNCTFSGLNFIGTWKFLYNNDAGLRGMEDPWRPNFTDLFVELKDGAEFKTASLHIRDAKLRRVNPQLQKKKPELFLDPMRNWHLRSEFRNGVNTGGAIQYVWMFGIIGTFVLLLACINFMNLSTARSERRAREVGIRKTIGSVRGQLISQFYTESLLTVFLAFLIALLLVAGLLRFFNDIAGKDINVPWSQPLFWAACIGFAAFCGIIAGSYPALYLSKFNPIHVLKGTYRAGKGASLPRKILVVFQFTVSVALVIGTVVVYRQIQFARNRPTGYSRDDLIIIPTMNESIHQHFDAVRSELEKQSLVASMSESQGPTTEIWNSTSGFSWPEKDPNLSVDFAVVLADYNFGKTIGWHVIDGRDLSKDFLTDTSSVLLNQAAVKYMGLKNPVGTNVTWWGQPLRVIGVVADMVMESPYAMPRPTIYGLATGPGNVVLLRLKAGVQPQAAIPAIAATFKKFNTEQPFEYRFVDEDYSKKFTSEERIGKLATCFTVLAILISCLGLFGLSSFLAEQRTKEIGIRKVLGASTWSLWNLLSRDFVVLVVISFAIAVPLSWISMNRWLSDYSYRIHITWWIFLGAGLLTIIIAMATVSFQAIRAAFNNPSKSLRTE